MKSVRTPLPLVMHDKNSCGSTCVANILYMFGKVEAPIDFNEIDRMCERPPGKPANEFLLPLLRQAFNLTQISGLDAERALGPDGYSYMQEYDATMALHNPASPRFTPANYEVWKRKTDNFRREIKKAPGKLRVVTRPPTFDDIRLLLKQVPVVAFSVWDPSAVSPHTCLAYGKPKNPNVFWPSRDEVAPPFLPLSLSYFEETFYQGQIVGITA